MDCRTSAQLLITISVCHFMNKSIQKIYLAMPSWAKTVLVGLYGLKIYSERYGKFARYYENLLKKSQKYSREEMCKYQERTFVELARTAIRDVPFYRNWAIKNGIKETDINSIESLKIFPVIEKEDVRSNPEQFVSSKYNKKELIKLSTSGSTGKPVKIYVDKKSRTFHYSFFTRLRDWYGIGKGEKRITFLGRVVVSSSKKTPPFWVYDVVQRNLIMSAYHLSDDKLVYYYNKIVKFKPSEIFGYASSIYQLAKFIVDKGYPRIRIKLVMTTAETLMPYQRDTIKQAFECSLVNQYGCTEMAFFGAENPEGNMLMHPEHAVIEILDDNGTINFTGTGEVIATSLINSVMPLIRYKVGDRVSISNLVDPNYPGFDVLDSLEGRTDDVIYTKDGRAIGRMSPIFRSDKCIVSAQVIQEEDGTVNIYVVPTADYCSKHRKLIRSEATERIGNSVEINIHEVGKIEGESNGKFRPVKSSFNPNI